MIATKFDGTHPAARTGLAVVVLSLTVSGIATAAESWESTRTVETPANFESFGSFVDVASEAVVATGIKSFTPFQGGAVTFSVDLNDVPAELIPSGTPNDNAFLYPAISASRVLVGDDEELNPTTGAAYLFDRSTGNQITRLTAPDGVDGSDFWFGQGVELTSSYALVSGTAFRNPGIYVYAASDGQYSHKIDTPTRGALSANGQLVLVGEFNETATLFDIDTGSVLQDFENPLPDQYDSFGIDVALSGDFAAISSRRRGSSNDEAAVFVFNILTGQLAYTLTDEANQHFTVDADDNRLITTAKFDSTVPTRIFDLSTGALIDELPSADEVAIDGGFAVLGQGNRVLVYQQVPEPANCLLAAIGLLCMHRRSRRL